MSRNVRLLNLRTRTFIILAGVRVSILLLVALAGTDSWGFVGGGEGEVVANEPIMVKVCGVPSVARHMVPTSEKAAALMMLTQGYSCPICSSHSHQGVF